MAEIERPAFDVFGGQFRHRRHDHHITSRRNTSTFLKNACLNMSVAAEKNLIHLKQLGIEYKLATHVPVFTLEAMFPALEGQLEQGDDVVKNLFLKDKKGGLWLATIAGEAPVDLKSLQKKLEVGWIGAEGRKRTILSSLQLHTRLFDATISSYHRQQTSDLHQKNFSNQNLACHRAQSLHWPF